MGNSIINETTIVTKPENGKGKGKGVPFTGHEGPLGDVVAKVHICTAMARGRGRMASLMLSQL